MERSNNSTKALIITLLCVINLFWVSAQNSDSDKFVTISGIVKDQKTKKTLESVNISIAGTTIGTVSNADGRFSLKLKEIKNGDKLEISHIGYVNKIIEIPKNPSKDVIISLVQNSVLLDEVVIISGDPKSIVQQAVDKINDNYSMSKNHLVGFYRETVQKGHKYIDIAEAITDIYKTPYNEDVKQDRLQIYKGRKLLSQKKSDTLAVKLQGGPNLVIVADLAKSPEMLFESEKISGYTFRFDKMAMINDRPNYTIIFTPNTIMPYALYNGKLYIDKETLAFSRAEIHLDMSDSYKATEAMLRKKPIGLRFKPKELSITISYKQSGDRSYLKYIRNDIRFKCDWKRKLFATNYTVISESVITDINKIDAITIPYKKSFKLTQSLSDNVKNFYDENFWEDYNIIEPSESLENAVNKLKKKAVQ